MSALTGTQVVEVSFDLIDVEYRIEPEHEEPVVFEITLSFSTFFVTGLQNTICVPHLPGGIWDGRGITLPPRVFHCANVAHHLDEKPCFSLARSKRIGFSPRSSAC